MNVKVPKKLIEVALPLDDINQASAREKSIRHGHPSTMHLWWARRPLATARAVLFAQLVNDPGYERNLQRGVNKEKAQIERERLFGLIRKLVVWENSNDDKLLAEVRSEIWNSWRETCELNKTHPNAADLFNPEKLPAGHDPFAGGGAIPLEIQRLGLESWASDLNPVAVLINKAMIEIPYKFAGKKPVGPILESQKQDIRNQPKFENDWSRSKGLAEDIYRYGEWLNEAAFKRIGHFYPKVEISDKKGADSFATVVAWIWARTVKSPNPVFRQVDVPLISSFFLSTKKGKEVWIEPIVEKDQYRFEIRTGSPKNREMVKNGTKLATGAHFRCLLSDTPISPEYIKEQAMSGKMGVRLIAIVAESKSGRAYLNPDVKSENLALTAEPAWTPELEFFQQALGFRVGNYGMTKWSDLFTKRQLLALNTFCELIPEVHEKVRADAISQGWVDDGVRLEDGGSSATAYADAVCVYLASGVSKMADRGSTICSWDSSRDSTRNTFGRQAIPMTWDFAESNPFSDSTGNFTSCIQWSEKVLKEFRADRPGFAIQHDAQTQTVSRNKIVSTDPPYYDNIGYADLSDFFYVWLRRSLKSVFPLLLGTMAVPKAEELVATPHRHGGKHQAEDFFLAGMTKAMHQISIQSHPAFPVTIYYAFKQSETGTSGTASTGWETFLDATLRSGFAISGTWPMRTELGNRMRGTASNALASSIVLVCRARPEGAATISRRDFLTELKTNLPEALETMIGGKAGHSPIAPVDLAQAAIGPGMAVFSQYEQVIEADGQPMTVHTALTLINKMIDDYFNEAEVELDADTRFCIAWFSEYGWSAGPFGEADVLARAKGTSVENVKTAGVIESGAGKVRLLKVLEYPSDWNPKEDTRTPAWEALHHLIRALNSGGEQSSGELLAGMPERADVVRPLAYRLYTLCERNSWAEEARFYNELITSWHAIEEASFQIGRYGDQIKLNL